MPVKFHCGCGATLIVSRRRIGMSIRCPKCEQQVTVPKPKKSVSSQASPTPKKTVPPPPPRPPRPERPVPKPSEPAPPPVQSPPLESIGPTEIASTSQPASKAEPTPPAPPPSTRPTDPPSPEPRQEATEQLAPPKPLEPIVEVFHKPDLEGDGDAEQVALKGYVPDRGKTSTARLLATAMALAAICSTLPAILEMVAHFRFADSPGVARWAYLLFFAGTVQLAYAVYLLQLPDWSSVLVVTVVCLVAATCYAAVLSLTVLGSAESAVIASLDLTDQMSNGRAAGWCFIMLCIAALLSYFSGRIGIRWKRVASGERRVASGW